MAVLFSCNEDFCQMKTDISVLGEEDYYISQDADHTLINKTAFVSFSHKSSGR